MDFDAARSGLLMTHKREYKFVEYIDLHAKCYKKKHMQELILIKPVMMSFGPGCYL